MLSEINICIIVPCYNEENNFHIEEYEKIISEYSDVLICFVDDGVHGYAQPPDGIVAVEILFTSWL